MGGRGGEADGGFRLYELPDEEDTGISLTIDVINKKILQIISFEDIGPEELDLIKSLTENLADTCKMILKTFVKGCQ